MKELGITRRLDDLGRIVIPREIRRTLHLHEGDAMEMSLCDGGILLKPYNIGKYLKTAKTAINALRQITGASFKLSDHRGQRIFDAPNQSISEEESAALISFSSLYMTKVWDDKENHRLFFRILNSGETCMMLFTSYKEEDDVNALTAAGKMAVQMIEAEINI